MENWNRLKPRKHMLFVPADKPAMYRDVIMYHPDTVMFDLEDAVAMSEKDSARILFREVLKTIDYNKYGIETCVRVNGTDTPWFEDDVKAAIQANVNMIRFPKVETIDQVTAAIQVIEKYEKEFDKLTKTVIFLAFESALGILNSFEIAKSNVRIVGVALGGVDYLVDLKAQKLPNRVELLYARQHLVHVARALKIEAFDVVYGNINDAVGFEEEFRYVKALGFNGKSVVHPNQIGLINKVYQPQRNEIEYAREMIKEFEKFQKSGKGVFAFRGTMVDKPVVEKQREILDLAQEFGMEKGINEQRRWN